MQLDIDFLHNTIISLPRKVAFLERFHSDKRSRQIKIVFKIKFLSFNHMYEIFDVSNSI